MIATLAFGAIGFVDDYSKMAKQRSLGLTGRQKLLAQLLVAVCVWAVLFAASFGGTGYSWNISIPFFKTTASRLERVHRSLFIFGLDRGGAVGIFERGEPDGWFGWTGDQHHVHRDERVDRIYLSQQRRALGRISRLDAPAGSGGADDLLWRDGRRESRFPLVQRAARAGLYGRRRQPRDRRGNGDGGGADEAGVHVVDGGWCL